MTDRPDTFRGHVALAIGLVVASAILGAALSQIRRGSDDLVVTGSARKPIRSDYVVWRASVTAQQPTLGGANPELRRYADRVRAWLRTKGVADSVITFLPVETQVIQAFENGTETGRIQGYRLRQSFRIASRDVDQLTRIAQAVGELVEENVPLVSEQLEYLYTQLPEARKAMLAEATQDAKDRAEAIAKAAGAKVGAVRNVRMGVFQVTPRFSTEVSDYGVNDTQSIDKDITAVVRVTFAVD